MTHSRDLTGIHDCTVCTEDRARVNIQKTGPESTFRRQGQGQHSEDRARVNIQKTGPESTFRRQGQGQHSEDRARVNIQKTGPGSTFRRQGQSQHSEDRARVNIQNYSTTEIHHKNNNNRIERRNWRFLLSPRCAMNCLQHVRSSGPGAIVRKSCATCRVPLGINEGTAQLLSLTECKSHLFELYFNYWLNH